MSHHATFQIAYDSLTRHYREIALLSSVESLLGWDERTIMPHAAGEYRAEQMTYLAGLLHDKQTDPRIGEWLDILRYSAFATDQHSDTGATIRELDRDYQKSIKLPKSLVEELTRATVLGQQIWEAARKNNDFRSFQPALEKILHLKRQEADALGYKQCRYDALLDDYEPHETTANVRSVLAGLRDELVPLVAAIRDASRRPDESILERLYPAPVQERLGREAARSIGFDFQAGRLDVSAHPFCSEMGPADCRITTRYDERFFPSSFFGILHESGHGLYEQGIPKEPFGLPLGETVSLGIHESQSRMWENLVGRSRAFWEHWYPKAQTAFAESLTDVSLDAFYFAINAVKPSLIRVEADEATYNLHILLRFELEQDLLDDKLKVADLPGAWNEKYRSYLGVSSPDDADGVLQDIHWSAGLIGYFPTYSLGNLHASQLFETADAELGGLSDMFRRGEFMPLLTWLRKNVHRHGKRYTASELIERVSKKPLSHEPLMRHLKSKLSPLYGLA